jgi:hypothetical protein
VCDGFFIARMIIWHGALKARDLTLMNLYQNNCLSFSDNLELGKLRTALTR